ncbi:MAG: hypothetical protein COW48_01020 [Hydrogenophilales bacterium CG17_big_fil_post_rev_8_21_14_2_50_63_12]|nr:MAG: hypothetical protein COW48_01020 [Hydrogenophilales bacterium CG17_big_fil_post_rev_8_21_14_2_50_63_12]PIX97306.1 MAG: hypothetical protein COZ24_06040 [Hydrogenophilales bacterium CG_4_10_14_3_um_filter_63_21]PJB06165.1 MAG: hypothetical protein CO126_02555 [Hydrogenophilales bacterium CG_4_9_14_3_um_filter_63_34]
MNELQAFLEDQGVYGCIDAFGMADWVVAVTTEERLAKIADKPLAATERNTLLIAIAALCKYEGLDPQARGTAQRIMEMTDDLGAHVDDGTIRTALKKIPDALETRMK